MSWPGTLRFCAWSLAAVLPALAAGWWWVRTADAIKALNPGAYFISSTWLVGFNFGSLAQRSSGEFWTGLYRQWTTAILPGIALVFLVVAGLLFRGQWRALVGLCVAGFLGSQLIFANLYYLHTYYFFANAFMLAGALGLAGCHLLDCTRLPAWLRLAGWLALLAAGGVTYAKNFLPSQRVVQTGQTGLSTAIQSLTASDDVLAVLGDDWSSAIPFSARRRAVMARADVDAHGPAWRESLAKLADEHLPLLIVKDSAALPPGDLRRRLDEFHMHPQPLFSYQGTVDVYVRKDLLHDVIGRLRGAHWSGIDVPPLTPAPAGEQRFDPRRDRAAFIMMTPYPVRYNTPFDAPAWQEHENTPVFIAHTPTELEFAIPAGARTLTLEYGMIPAAYLQHDSDGVEIVVELGETDGLPRQLWRRWLNPRDHPEDRRRFTESIALPPAAAGRLFVRTFPGPDNNTAYDWVYFSEVTIR